MIKHISFDLWDTLYKGNPQFHKLREEYLHEKFRVSETEVKSAIKKTKTLCDGTSEKTMWCIDSKTQLWHLLDNLGCASIKNAQELFEFTHTTFLNNIPRPTFTKDDLIGLKQSGLSISISCNTGLISGKTVRDMLIETDIYNLFDFCLFSDEIGYFKPNPFFMDMIISIPNCKANHFEEVLHIGDNLNTDGYLCQLTGTNFYNNPKGSIDFTQIYKFL